MLVVMVSDASSLQVFPGHCLGKTFEVVVVPTLCLLAEATAEAPPTLLAADLYTLDHQGATYIALLQDYAALPLLIVSQESGSGVRGCQPPSSTGRPPRYRCLRHPITSAGPLRRSWASPSASPSPDHRHCKLRGVLRGGGCAGRERGPVERCVPLAPAKRTPLDLSRAGRFLEK